MAEDRLHLADRLALRPKEAAQVIGVSERTLRDMLPQLPHFREGGVILLPVEPLRQWLADRVRAEAERVAGAVRAMQGNNRK